MTSFRVSPAALLDLDEIDETIATDSPAAAERLIQTIFERFEALAEYPGIGHVRGDLTKLPVRFLTVRGRYMIVYREGADGIEIVRVIGAGRDVSAILAD